MWAQAMGRNMTQPFTLAVAQLLTKRIPPFRATANSDTTVVTPILHTYTTPASPLGTNRMPSSFSNTSSRRPSRAFAALLLPLDAQLFECARWRSSVGGSSLGGSSHVCSQPTGGLPGGGIRRSRSCCVSTLFMVKLLAPPLMND